MERIVGRCRHSTLESCLRVLSSSNVAYTFYPAPSCERQGKHDRDRSSFLAFDSRVLPKSAKQWKRGLHIFHDRRNVRAC